jgi:pimeloyl-ACP methyl ester carboxylesterase
MRFAHNQGVRVHYEVEGKGSPLVLQRGFSDSLQTWYELGYVDGLKSDYQLILVDARGHGASDKPHEPEAYKPESNAADVVAVLTDLGISRAHFFGYSLGGWIAFAMAQYAPEHVHALIIGGANPHQIAPADPVPTGVDAGSGGHPRALGSTHGTILESSAVGERRPSAYRSTHSETCHPQLCRNFPENDDAVPGVRRRSRPGLSRQQGIRRSNAECDVLFTAKSKPSRSLFLQIWCCPTSDSFCRR